MSYAQSLTPISAALPATGLRALREGTTPETTAPRPTPQPVIPNPALRLDAQLGLVVLEFRDENGKVDHSLPTRRELDAYRAAGRVTEKTPWLQDPLAPQQAADAMDGKGQLVPFGSSPPRDPGTPASQATAAPSAPATPAPPGPSVAGPSVASASVASPSSRPAGPA